VKLLTAIIDHAGADLASQVIPDLAAHGVESGCVIYSHNAALRAAFVEQFSVASRVYAPDVLRAVQRHDFHARRKDWTRRERLIGLHGLLLADALLLARRLLIRSRLAPEKYAQSLIALSGHVRGLICDIVEARRILCDARPDAVILTHDYVGHFTSILAREAKRRGIPVILLPALQPSPDALVRVLGKRAVNWAGHGKVSILTARLFPKWIRSYEGRQVLRLRTPHILALELLGLSVKNPWPHHSGVYDFISLGAPSWREEYLRHGHRADRLKLHPRPAVSSADSETPDPDEVVGDPALPRAVIAIPPDQIASGNHGGGYAAYSDLLEDVAKLADALRATHCIELTGHPKDDRSALEPLRARGLPISSRRTRTALEGASIFMTYTGSATIAWGEEMALPTFVWDPFGYGPAYRNGVATPVDGPGDLLSHLKRLPASSAAANQAPDAREFAPGFLADIRPLTARGRFPAAKAGS